MPPYSDHYQPDFIPLPGNLIGPHPLHLQWSSEINFIFRADLDALQHTVDAWLNKPIGRQKSFRALNPFVLVTYVNCSCSNMSCAGHSWQQAICPNVRCARAWLLGENRRKLAYLKYNLLTFTVFATSANGDTFGLVPFSFVDDGTAMVYFRENYGMNVTLGEFDSGEKEWQPGSPTFLDCFANMDGLTPTNVFKDAPAHMLRLEPRETMGDVESWSEVRHARGGMLKHLCRNLGIAPGVQPTSDHLHAVVRHMLKQQKSLALKQFRGMPDGVNAFYKALNAYGPDVGTFHSAETVTSDFVLDFPCQEPTVLNNFPLAKDLGLKSGLRSVGAFQTHIDYRLRALEVVEDVLRRRNY
ncbi:MAG: hypothetical protein AAF570_08605 [Bacteroidota bacterium]